MWKKRLLSHDPLLGKTEWYWHDDVTDTGKVEEVWDVSSIVEANKAMYAATDARKGWKGDWHHIASLPMSVAQDLWNKSAKGKDQKALKRFINDPDNRAFLVRPVKL